MFTIEMGFGYPGHGEPVPEKWQVAYCPHQHRIGEVSGNGVDLWWELDATVPADVERVTTAVGRAWERDGLPFLDACTDPRALVEHGARSGKLTLELADLSLLLGERGPAERAVHEYLDSLRSYDPGQPSPYNRYPETHLLGPYAVAASYLRKLGEQLPDGDRRRVVDAFGVARRAAAEGEYGVASSRNAALLRELARELGEDASFIDG